MKDYFNRFRVTNNFFSESHDNFVFVQHNRFFFVLFILIFILDSSGFKNLPWFFFFLLEDFWRVLVTLKSLVIQLFEELLPVNCQCCPYTLALNRLVKIIAFYHSSGVSVKRSKITKAENHLFLWTAIKQFAAKVVFN